MWSPRERCWSWRRTWSEGCSTHPACGGRADSGPSRCRPPHGRSPSPHGRCSPSCGTWLRRTPPQEPRRKSPGTSTPGRPARISPGAGLREASEWHPRQRGSASRQPSSGTPTRGHAISCRRARSRPPRQTPRGDGKQGGLNRCRPLGPPVVVFAHGHPGPCRPSRQGGFPAAAPPRRDPAPQPAGRGGLGTVEGRWRAPEPVFPPGPGPGATPRREHGDRGMGGDRAWHGVQVDHCGRPTAHAIAAGVQPPATGGPLLGPPTPPYEGRMEGHAEPHQGVADEPGCTVPAGAGARTAHGPHTPGPPRPAQGVGPYKTAHRRDAAPGAGAAAGALPADQHPARGHVQPPGLPEFASPRQGHAPGGRGGTVADTPQPVHRTRPLVPIPTPLPTPGGPGAPPAEPVPHAPGAPGRAELPAAAPAHPLGGAGP